MTKYIIKDGKRVPRETVTEQKSSDKGSAKKPTSQGKNGQKEGSK